MKSRPFESGFRDDGIVDVGGFAIWLVFGDETFIGRLLHKVVIRNAGLGVIQDEHQSGADSGGFASWLMFGDETYLGGCYTWVSLGMLELRESEISYSGEARIGD